MLLNQNSELKNMNEMLIGKMKEIPELIIDLMNFLKL